MTDLGTARFLKARARLRNLKERAFSLLEKHPEGMTLPELKRALHYDRFPRKVWEKAWADLLTSGWVVKTVEGPSNYGLRSLADVNRLSVVPGIDPLTREHIGD